VARSRNLGRIGGDLASARSNCLSIPCVILVARRFSAARRIAS
jgi:hypothetical protein